MTSHDIYEDAHDIHEVYGDVHPCMLTLWVILKSVFPWSNPVLLSFVHTSPFL